MALTACRYSTKVRNKSDYKRLVCYGSSDTVLRQLTTEIQQFGIVEAASVDRFEFWNAGIFQFDLQSLLLSTGLVRD